MKYFKPLENPRITSVRDLQTAVNLPCVYDYVTHLWRLQAEIIQNHGNEHVYGIGQSEARQKKNKRLKLRGGKA
jgi:hypothetical protein